MRRLLSILSGLALFINLHSQERTVLYSHYTFNGLALNPAYAGSHDMLSISLSRRSQWVGFEGAPSYNILGLHTPFKNTRMGIGLLVMNESIGLRNQTGIYVNYAHRVTVGSGKLALGLKGGIRTGSFETQDLGDGDVVFGENAGNYLLPNFGVGMYYYTRKFRAGFSIPLLMGYKSDLNGEVIAYHEFNKYAYYFTTGVKLDIAPNWQVEPSALLEYDKAGGVIADGGLELLFKDILKVGASYRVNQALVMLLDFKVNYQLSVGIAYDYGMNEISKYNRNSYEIALEYNFGYKIKASNPAIF